MTLPTDTHEGGCTCGQIRYKMTRKPLIVHCCHCRWCQRQTGASFALNALIEVDYVELPAGNVENVMVPSPGGKGQQIARCPECRVAVWSNYHFGGLFDRIHFIRVGTLDNPDLLPPDIHIFTSSKQPWIVIPPEDNAVPEYYSKGVWSEESMERMDVLKAKIESSKSV
jgi:hypothetical protein